uniref:Uncharacterized protein n=1 Tax=Oryza meridionalis TaxID=40149 RepID=A0A0E0EX77_9ORYZ
MDSKPTPSPARRHRCDASSTTSSTSPPPLARMDSQFEHETYLIKDIFNLQSLVYCFNKCSIVPVLKNPIDQHESVALCILLDGFLPTNNFK